MTDKPKDHTGTRHWKGGRKRIQDDIADRRFGRLVAVSPVIREGQETAWLCRCDCGSQRIVRATELRRAHVKSCGCAHVKHASYKTPEYYVWSAMIARCRNPKHINYRRYGGRGITVCDEWVADFNAFIASVGLRPSPDYSIDRIDNDSGYAPGNVRWATRSQQAINRSEHGSSRRVRLDGRRMSVREMAKELAISYDALKWRLMRAEGV